MQRTPVDSSNVHSVGHDETGLEVQFHRAGCARGTGPIKDPDTGEKFQAACNCPGGDVWHYPGVPAEIGAGIMLASSPCSHFHKHVKAAKHFQTGQPLYPGAKRKAEQ